MRTEPVVMVHGWGGSFARTWQEPGWEALLGDMGRTVIGVDLLGHGTAPKPHDPAAYDDVAARVRDAMPPAGQVDAIGFSMGSFVLLDVASAEPHRFRRLVVSGVGENLFRAERDDAIAEAVEGNIDPEHPLARAFAGYANWPGNDAKALAAILRRDRRPFTAEQLARVTCPVLVVLGDKDFAGLADPLMAALADARLVTLKGCDHFATPKDFRFIDAALEFLAGD